MFAALYRLFDETDASLAEINPLIVTGDGKLVALDAKLNFDANALFRHPDIVAMRDLDEEDPAEVEASKFDLSYISLDGNIGCLVNGAGLAMATMDVIKLYGGNPANFLDVGGGASAEKVTEAFKIMLRNKDLKAILVNIFGGIMRCDVIAEGVIAASKAVSLKVPLVVRMKGTNEQQGTQAARAIGPADHHREQHGGGGAEGRRGGARSMRTVRWANPAVARLDRMRWCDRAGPYHCTTVSTVETPSVVARTREPAKCGNSAAVRSP